MKALSLIVGLQPNKVISDNRTSNTTWLGLILAGRLASRLPRLAWRDKRRESRFRYSRITWRLLFDADALIGRELLAATLVLTACWRFEQYSIFKEHLIITNKSPFVKPATANQ